MKLHVSMVVKIYVAVFWVVTPCDDSGGIPTFRRTFLPPSSGYHITKHRQNSPPKKTSTFSSMKTSISHFILQFFFISTIHVWSLRINFVFVRFFGTGSPKYCIRYPSSCRRVLKNSFPKQTKTTCKSMKCHGTKV